MYQDVKLEKGLYHLAGKSFLQALEDADTSAQYANTPLSRLDAYERQLKRFDIRVCGTGCDRVEKFFTTTESAVLFPEFVRRAVVQGMQETVLSDLTAAVTRCESNRYQGAELTTPLRILLRHREAPCPLLRFWKPLTRLLSVSTAE